MKPITYIVAIVIGLILGFGLMILVLNYGTRESYITPEDLNEIVPVNMSYMIPNNHINNSWVCNDSLSLYKIYNVTNAFDYCRLTKCGNIDCMHNITDFDNNKDGKLDAFEIEIMEQAQDRINREMWDCFDWLGKIDMECGRE